MAIYFFSLSQNTSHYSFFKGKKTPKQTQKQTKESFLGADVHKIHA